MATFKCSGRKRRDEEGNPYCLYQAPRRWMGHCPGCGRLYDCEKVSLDKGSRATLETLADRKPPPRILTGIAGLDAVLGGGIVKGSTVFISGPRGVGKTTILLQAAANIGNAVYASGEQTVDDIALTAQRLGITNQKGVRVLGLEGDIYKIAQECESDKPKLLVIDSLQTCFCDDCKADEGSAEQVRAVANFLTAWCKREGVACIAISHVNKQGDMAGPEAAGHLCDVILELDPVIVRDEDGQEIKKKSHIVLRVGGKNRYGSADTEAKYKMTEKGLVVYKGRSKPDEGFLSLVRGKDDEDETDFGPSV